ncbi:MAG: hypothetical protein RLZZ54_1995 [Cyanobacteriota bacterium]|jgi:hypothetical protein
MKKAPLRVLEEIPIETGSWSEGVISRDGRRR